MTYAEVIRAAREHEPLSDEPSWLQEQVMAFALGWRSSPVHYCVAMVIGTLVIGVGLIRLSESNEVTVVSEPAGASVSIDGVPRGETPLTLAEADRAEHRVDLRKEGFEPAHGSFIVSPGAPSKYVFKLERPLGVLPPAAAATAVPPALPDNSISSAFSTPSSTRQRRGNHAGRR